MKIIIFIFLVLIVNNSFAQKELKTTSGVINFEASVPLFEEVAATNKTATCTINLRTGVLTTAVVMKDFRFNLSLMEEHFNKKYLETDRYPNAYFKGKIEGFNLNIIGTVPKDFKLNGILKIHGTTKKISTLITLKKINNSLNVTSNFSVQVKDFDIQIPEILRIKIAETVLIKSDFLLQ